VIRGPNRARHTFAADTQHRRAVVIRHTRASAALRGTAPRLGRNPLGNGASSGPLSADAGTCPSHNELEKSPEISLNTSPLGGHELHLGRHPAPFGCLPGNGVEASRGQANDERIR
jgi:hypothetical protein